MLIGILTVSVLVIVASRTTQSFDREARRKAAIERMRPQLRAGVGSEVRFASAGARTGDVRASLDSMAEFIRYRAGLDLNAEAKERLARMEERVLNGGGRRIPADELGGLFTSLLVERLNDCTDAEIEQAADDLTNLNRPMAKYKAEATQAAAAPRVVMRLNGQGQMSRERFILQAKALRERLQSPLQQVALVAIARQMITRVVRDRVETLSAALPEQWGRTQEEGLTPAQAFLIAYSAASDDPLMYSREGLNNVRTRLELTWKTATGEANSYEGRAAFGAGGYLFSSPLGLAFNPETTSRMLKLLDERSAK
ncbi:MAG TPA: hypothetical protein VKA60_22300 [Blastocatellia bacterium]|nr:hypothetical protein [Blastocatellia bacterium]